MSDTKNPQSRPQGNQDGHLADTEGIKALSSKADNHCPVCGDDNGQLKQHLVKKHGWRYYDGVNPEPPRADDAVSDMKPSDSSQDKGHSKSPSNGSGSQDSIDQTWRCLNLDCGVWNNVSDDKCYACGNHRGWVSPEILAWHNTQLKAAEANAVEKWCASLFAEDPVLKAKLEAAMQANMEKL